ncbi:hypothetical protein CEUSTIGMA_g9104.t1 [Chlamydomonas eustigma]|uniref:Uncharacterized protein n=1 Tax=Chlamydomonas eustigma TaxID=1157962 RepID=A0A250XF71_9CHLO|nr:hypothetical protein CEUSTIGMA_g9104.t1 [Chlamydomonas eustigma]|eukprot:GAX81676.1 hypothetical protein CEUSTIGMA_g9104.t1 [Chlamydomonas eustigma]
MSDGEYFELTDTVAAFSVSCLEELSCDILYELTSRLDGRNRHALSSCSKLLQSLMNDTFSEVALSIPLQKSCSKIQGRNSLAYIRKLSIQLPDEKSRQGTDNSSIKPVAALSSFLDVYFNKDKPLPRLESLSLHQDDCMTSIVTYDALSHIASVAKSLHSISLPMLSPEAACALPLLSTSLTSLNLVVSDSPSLDFTVQLPCLQHLSISTREGLYYLLLSLGQLSDLSKLTALKSLKLNQVFISDCRQTFNPLSALTSLTELCVSSPVSMERLNQLPSSLQILQLPSFAGGLEAAAGLGHAFNLTELRCRQALTETDLNYLSHLRNLSRLSCDNIILSDSKVQAVQAVLMSQPAEHGIESDGDSSLNPSLNPVPLPVLAQIKSLCFTGYHKHNGLLGLMFPGLEMWKVSSVEVPHPCPPHVAPLPCLKHLVLPSCKVLPSLLAACPALTILSVPGINCLQRLEELLHLAPPPITTASAQGSHAQLATRSSWWPPHLKTLSLGFSSSLRFRPKQIAASLSSMPVAIRCCVRHLELQDRGRDAGTGMEPAGRVVDDSVLASAVAALQGIEALRLVDCGAVSGVGLCQVMQQLAGPKLANVEVIGCPQISRAELEGMPCMLGRPFMVSKWCPNSVCHTHTIPSYCNRGCKL